MIISNNFKLKHLTMLSPQDQLKEVNLWLITKIFHLQYSLYLNLRCLQPVMIHLIETVSESRTICHNHLKYKLRFPQTSKYSWDTRRHLRSYNKDTHQGINRLLLFCKNNKLKTKDKSTPLPDKWIRLMITSKLKRSTITNQVQTIWVKDKFLTHLDPYKIKFSKKP